MLHCIGDFERISDHGVNIMESAQELYGKRPEVSDKALEELRVMEHAVEDIVDIAYKVYVKSGCAACERDRATGGSDR